MKRPDWNLLVLAAAAGKPLTPVQLQKSLFLLGKTCPGAVGKEFYKFRPYDYGPFDEDVYRDARALESLGLASISTSTGRYAQYLATPEGLQEANRIVSSVSPVVWNYIQQVVGWAQRLSFSQLVKAVYETYPEFREKSIFKG